jgi:type IV pilus assembly protein PilW
MTMIIDLRKQKGLTLIELMIALVIGLLLLAGTISMFISNKRVYKEQESMGRLQENARFALGLIVHDIRMAGYTGCADDDPTKTTNHVNGASGTNLLDFSNAIEGSDSASKWQPSNSTDVTSSMVPGTDGISIRFLEDTGLKVLPPYMVTTSSALHVNVNNGLYQGEMVGVADCNSADIFQITSTSPDTSGTVGHNTGTGTPGNASKDLKKVYLGDASIVRFVSRRYYIRNDADGVPALYWEIYGPDREDSNNNGNTTEVIQHSEELIKGVENMQILYGEDTSGADKIADTYVTAKNVSNWANVVSVRIALLFRTIKPNNQIEPDTSTHSMLGGTVAGGATVGPMNDYYRRRVITATVQIRNRST